MADQKQESNAIEEVEPNGDLDELLKKLPKNLPPQATSQIVSLVVQMRERYSGPLPHPRHLKEYDLIVPGLAQKIFEIMERQVSHRMAYENRQQEIDRAHYRLGQYFGFSVFAIVMGLCFFCILTGKSWEGIAGIVAALASLLGIFLYDRRSRG